MYNKVILIGRLTKDPEFHSAENGNRATFSLAVDRDYEIEGQPNADFFDVVAFKDKADFISKWFKKGMLVLIEGRLQSRVRKDREGNNRTFVEVVADKSKFAEKRKAEMSSEDNNS